MPRLGIGMPVAAGMSQEAVVTIEDFVWELVSSGNITPLDTSGTINDTSNIWDFDSTDIMLEADPEDEGFWEEGSNLVLNHDYEDLGGDLTSPLDFTNWINSTATDITANSFTTGGSGQGVFYSLTTNKVYQVNVSGITGDISIRYRDGGGAGTVLGAFDTNLYFDTSGLSSPNIYIRALSATNATVTDVSIKEVDPNDRWTLGTGWTIEDGKAVSAGHSTHSSCTQTLSLPIGQYEVSFALTVTSGSFSIQAQGSGSDTGSVITSSGVHTEIFTTTKNRSTFLIRSNDGNGVGSVDNVTVREYAIQPQDV